MRLRLQLFASLAAISFWVTSLHAAEEPNVKQARDLFVKGAELVKNADWASALAAFEESAKLRPHPVTTFNIGACLRSMGQSTRAKKAFVAALEENQKSGEMPPALAEETKRTVEDIDKLLARVDVTLAPEGGRIALDGRPLEPSGEEEGKPLLVAGILPAGPGADAPKGTFRVLLDPGSHVITVSRIGFADAIRKETWAPGARAELTLQLDKLPATFNITSNQPGSQVLMNELDVGLTPVEISRPSGTYHVVVKKGGFLPFETNTTADPGQTVNIPAALREDKPALTQRWWFWAGAAVIVAGATTATYLLTRPDPERPPVNGGGLGWAVRAP